MILRTFGWSFVITGVTLVVSFFYGGWPAMGLCLILGLLEVSLSFDNAIVNAKILETMSLFWREIFLTVGILIAVIGMRLLLPLLIVGTTAHLTPDQAIRLALEKGDPQTPGTYGFVLHQAHPQIAAFGAMFLLMLFLDFLFTERDHYWLTRLERPLAKLGHLDQASVIISAAALLAAAKTLADSPETVLVAGILGIITYLVVNGLGRILEPDGESGASPKANVTGGRPRIAGRAAFFLFLYLEVLDGSFSFDGVIGAFAITSDPIIIALGLGFIGATYVRSITVFLVRKGTLKDYIYLEHGAHWAIGALAVLLLVSIGFEVPQAVTGLLGLAFIGAALASSARARQEHPQNRDGPDREAVSAPG